jgi:Asp-tRNA(Asn)/Glu-tRNA(Gln) amidotransferase A subunit family amidase
MSGPYTSSLAASQALTGTEAIAAVSAGAASVSEVAARCLARVADLDPAIGAFRVIDEHAVHSRAKQLDDRVAGPLHGMVVGIKDVIDTADLPTGYGSALFAYHQPAADADVVAALRQAGAIVLGKTESTEFAMFQPTRTRNPVDPARTPGGSSSGSAAAVAAGMVPVALGTQTAGSVVRPAAYCGVYGFKPSWGWTSTAGIWRLSEHLDTVGLFARCVADLRLTYRVLSSPAAGPPPMTAHPAGKPAVAVLGTEDWGSADGDVRAALSAVAGRLSDDGWEVREMAMPPAWRHLPGQQEVLMAAEVAKNLHAALGDRVGQISDSAQAIVARGDRCLAAEYLAALEARAEALAALVPLAAVTDLLLAPSALGAAPVGLDFTGDPVMCRPWTLLGLPAANVPAWRRPDGLPAGVQLIGTRRDDLSYLTNLALAEAALTNPAAASSPAALARANQPDLTNPVALTPRRTD